MDLKARFGEAIKQQRAVRRLSQERLAIEANVDRRYLSDVENGKRNLSLDVMERIAHYFGMSVSGMIAQAERLDNGSLTLDTLKGILCEMGHDDAIVLECPDYISAVTGITDDGRVVYGYESMIESLMASDGMSREDAIEFIDYNTIRALPYAGPKAPIVIYDIMF